MRHYLFGYGSLINRSSRLATGQTGEAFPVRVKGLHRSWCVVAPEMNFTGLGVMKNPVSTCNGVLVQIDENELAAFDEREIIGSNYNYDRLLIPNNQIQSHSNLGSNIKIWSYIVKVPKNSDLKYPIVQSYVDVILGGCIDIGRDFADEFVMSTSGWHFPWLDDRTAPRYARYISGINTDFIDQILIQNIPTEFAKRGVDTFN